MKTPVRIASQSNYEAASGDHFWRLSTSVIPGLTRISVWIPALLFLLDFSIIFLYDLITYEIPPLQRDCVVIKKGAVIPAKAGIQ